MMLPSRRPASSRNRNDELHLPRQFISSQFSRQKATFCALPAYAHKNMRKFSSGSFIFAQRRATKRMRKEIPSLAASWSANKKFLARAHGTVYRFSYASDFIHANNSIDHDAESTMQMCLGRNRVFARGRRKHALLFAWRVRGIFLCEDDSLARNPRVCSRRQSHIHIRIHCSSFSLIFYAKRFA